jgi:hypothetical protein
MKRMLISEDEKSRILNLHQNLGYKTSLNEQSVPQQPQPNVQKPTEALGNYFTYDPIGKKIASISPTFAKWSTDNKIAPNKSGYQVLPNNTQLTQEKLNAAREAIKQKVAELNIGEVATSKCFVLNMYPPQKNTNPSGPSNNRCTTAYRDYDEVVKSTNFKYYDAMNQISKFASVAPKVQPKQG